MAGGLLGSKTGDFLTWVTIALVSVFLTLAVVMAKYYKQTIGEYGTGAPPASTPTSVERPTRPEPPSVPTVVTSEANKVADANLFGG